MNIWQLEVCLPIQNSKSKIQNLDALRVLAVHHVREENGAGVGSFTDKEYVLIYVLEGLCDYRVRGRRYLLRPGNALLMPPHTPHTVRPHGRIRHYVLHFSIPAEPQSLEHLSGVIQICAADRARFRRILSEVLKEWIARQPAWELAQTGLVSELLALYFRNMESTVKFEELESKAWRNVAHAIELVQRRYVEPLGLAELCSECGLSLSYFCRVFARHTGYSPHQYLNRIRVQKAKELLYDPRLNCTEVARRVGFSSIHAFSKVFRRHERLSPLQWARKRLQR